MDVKRIELTDGREIRRVSRLCPTKDRRFTCRDCGEVSFLYAPDDEVFPRLTPRPKTFVKARLHPYSSTARDGDPITVHKPACPSCDSENLEAETIVTHSREGWAVEPPGSAQLSGKVVVGRADAQAFYDALSGEHFELESLHPGLKGKAVCTRMAPNGEDSELVDIHFLTFGTIDLDRDCFGGHGPVVTLQG